MYGLGTILPEDEAPLPDIVARWETFFRGESITGPVIGSTPIVTSQSPPPPPVPMIQYSQPQRFNVPLPVTLAFWAAGALLLFFLAKGIRA